MNMTTAQTLTKNTLLPQKEILAWYMDGGVDETTGNAPYNFFDYTPPVKKQKPVTEKNVDISLSQAIAKNEHTKKKAESKAAPQNTIPSMQDIDLSSIDSIASLYKAMEEHMVSSPLKKGAKHTLLPTGIEKSPDILIFLDSPSDEEEISGESFTGIEARFTKKVLAAVGLDNNILYAYLCPWRPPGNRQLSPSETVQFTPYAKQLISLTKAKNVITLGEAALLGVTGETQTINKLRQKKLTIQGDAVNHDSLEYYAISHPSLYLNTPLTKQKAWFDISYIKQQLTHLRVA